MFFVPGHKSTQDLVISFVLILGGKKIWVIWRIFRHRISFRFNKSSMFEKNILKYGFRYLECLKPCSDSFGSGGGGLGVASSPTETKNLGLIPDDSIVFVIYSCLRHLSWTSGISFSLTISILSLPVQLVSLTRNFFPLVFFSS